MAFDTWATIFGSLGQGLMGLQELKDKTRQELAEETLRKRQTELYNRGTEAYEYEMSQREPTRLLNERNKEGMIGARQDIEEGKKFMADLDMYTGRALRLMKGIDAKDKVGALRDNPDIMLDDGIPENFHNRVLKELGATNPPDREIFRREPAPDPYGPALYNKINDAITAIDESAGEVESTKLKLSGPEYMTTAGVYDPTGKSKHSDPEYKYSAAHRAKAQVELRKTAEFNRIITKHKAQLRRLEGLRDLAKKSNNSFAFQAAQDAIDQQMVMVQKEVKEATGYKGPGPEKPETGFLTLGQ